MLKGHTPHKVLAPNYSYVLPSHEYTIVYNLFNLSELVLKLSFNNVRVCIFLFL